MWAGVDSAWEQEKPEARKMLENAAVSHKFTARFVRRFFVAPDLYAEKDVGANVTKFYTQNNFSRSLKNTTSLNTD